MGSVRKGLQRLALDRPELRAWALYDWANSGFWTVIVTAVFPIYFLQVVAEEFEPAEATRRFALATTLCLLAVAVVAPLLGAIADYARLKKKFLGAFMLLGVLSTAGLFLVERGDWLLGLVLFFLANLGAVGANVFYDSLLPHVAQRDELDRLSTTAFALGYLGGGLLLALVLVWILWPGVLGALALTEDGEVGTLPTRLALLAVAPWWLGFALPLFFRVEEPPVLLEADERPGMSSVRVAVTRMGETLRELRRYRAAFLMLCAFLLYNDGISTIIRLAAIYGAELELDRAWLIGSILLVQFVGVPCTVLFGKLARHVPTKTAILTSIVIYLGICVLAVFVRTAAHFVLLALLVGMVQGGCQALSRSLFASLIPKHKSGEFFGLFAVFDRFAGIFGPALFLAVAQFTGSSRKAIGSLVLFFLLGAAVLLLVDVRAGRAAARAAEAELT